MEPIRSLSERLEQATTPAASGRVLSESPAARYLLLSKNLDLLQLTALVRQCLTDETIAWDLSEMTGDPNVFILTLSGRYFYFSEPGLAFEGGYALLDQLGVDGVEPDYPTDVYASTRDVGDNSSGFELESADTAFWCWEDIEKELESRRRWALEEIRLPAAWNLAGAHSRGKGIVIAQPDTGITEHEILKRRQGPNLVGFDFIGNVAGAVEPIRHEGDSSHGTGTGSVAVGLEHEDMSGAAPLAAHLPIRAIRSVARITQGTVAQAIHYAISQGAHVISMSLGGEPSFALSRAISEAIAKNIIVIAAAGNCVGFAVWPARYRDCIGVAAVNRHGKMWKGSSHGKSIDISAPGENVFRARAVKAGSVIEHTCGQGQGTSFATALTAGAAACWLAYHGRDVVIAAATAQGKTVQQLFLKLVQQSARKPDASWPDNKLGAGILNVEELLRLPLDGPQDAESAHEPEAGEDFTVYHLLYEASGETADLGIDFERYGPEISLAILESARQLFFRSEGGALQPEGVDQDRGLRLSSDLDALVERHPVLKKAIRYPVDWKI